MRRILFAWMIVCISMLSTRLMAQQEEKLTVCTYYPAPAGSYKSLRLNPYYEADVTKCDQSRSGQIYYDLGFDRLRYCNMSGNWTNFTAGGGDPYWTENDTTHAIYNTYFTDKLAIGTPGLSDGTYRILHVVGYEGLFPPDHQTLVFLKGKDEIVLGMSSASTSTSYHLDNRIEARRGRGNTNIKKPSLDNDTLFKINATGHTGGTNGFQPAAKLVFSADGNFNSSNWPGKISFWTTPANSTVPLTRMTIKNDGKTGIGTTDPQQFLEVNSSMRLVPRSAPANYTGTVYFNNTTNTPAYADTAKWVNFVSEYGSVSVTSAMNTTKVTFRKTYPVPPLVLCIMDQRGNRGEFNTWVQAINITTTNVTFDMFSKGRWAGPVNDDIQNTDWTLYNTTNATEAVNYVVIPR